MFKVGQEVYVNGIGISSKTKAYKVFESTIGKITAVMEKEGTVTVSIENNGLYIFHTSQLRHKG